jgi:hypothetical protein
VIFERLRVAQIACDLVFQLRLRHHRIERRLGIAALFWPNPVTPVNVFNCPLKGDAFGEGEPSGLARIVRHSVMDARRLGGFVPSVRRIKGRTKPDKGNQKKRRIRGATNDVTSRFASRFHLFLRCFCGNSPTKVWEKLKRIACRVALRVLRKTVQFLLTHTARTTA